MPATLDTTQLGLPVEIGQISKELKKLWEADGNTLTRASMINFAVYCEGAEAAQKNTEFINEFTREHACRAILIIAEPAAPKINIRAWINAHCHLSRAGGKQVCCEQISFVLEGPAMKLIPNIVFSNLDSDLPLVLWWQAEFPDPIDGQLLTWVDRLVFDSQKWALPAKQFSILLDWLAQSQSRLAMCDLNWTRSLHLRQALAQMFDHPENREILEHLETVSICHTPSSFHRAASSGLVCGAATAGPQEHGGLPRGAGDGAGAGSDLHSQRRRRPLHQPVRGGIG